ncbi:hypothetical protein Glove_327g56 [Diversispora epigaea]|uniref:Uncharacterized protein n=1 Tax=Diversispora epigaea TaxID=1348612 RepID=A0A397HL66_9GLOM|nr:hypothetical protein Glove_327g56 [Diversispora epigaea]
MFQWEDKFYLIDANQEKGLLTSRERQIIFSTHQYFLNARKHPDHFQGMTLRKQVSTVLGVGEATVARVVAKYNKNDENLSSHKKLGQSKEKPDSNIAEYCPVQKYRYTKIATQISPIIKILQIECWLFFFLIVDANQEKGLLTSRERQIIFSTHQYFLNARKHPDHFQGMTLRKQVSTVLGVGEATVARVVAKYNKNDENLSSHKKLGQSKEKPDSNIAEVIYSLVLSANTSGSPLSTPILC